MPKYLIDANLPYYFYLWNSDDYIHQFDIDDQSRDEKIWDYAKENKLVIVTKDADFSNMMVLYGPPPKVIHLKIGNMKLKELYNFLSRNWPQVLILIEESKMVNVYHDRIEAIT